MKPAQYSSTKMGSSSSSKSLLLLAAVLLVLVSLSAPATGEDLTSECSPDVQKLMDCLEYATGKSDTPTTKCCSSVSGIRADHPVCLCFIIQQAHDSSSIKGLGLQIDRLTQLPDACKIANASVTNCPKLLNLSPSSPDNALFKNGTKASSPATGSAATTDTKSEGLKKKVDFGVIFAIVVASAISLIIPFSVEA